jgi:DNA-binding response OmpR family regulator
MASPKVLVVDDNQELLRLLCQLLEDAGYQVISSLKGRQGLELAREHKPQLAILDILLPDMMGYHLADTLRKELAIPILLMTGVFKGGKHPQDAKVKYGVVGYFEKPFEASKLLDAVAAHLPAEKRATVASEAFDVELDFDVEEERAQDPLELTGVVRVTGENISATLKGAPLTAGGQGPGQSARVRVAPEGHPVHDQPPAAGEARRGELKDNLPALITAFYLTKETGELGVQRGKVKKVVYFEQGQPVFALSNLVTDRFGQFLVRVGKINDAQLKLAMATAESTKRRTGDVLVQMGLLKETEQLYYVGQQVKSIIYSLFGWEEGTYQMSFKQSALRERIKLDVHPANLIMRGVKKLYKPERLRRLLLPDDRLIPSLQPAYALHELELERWEAECIPSVDGTRTVTDVLSLAGKPEHMTMGFLYGLVALSILERRA